MEKACKDCRVYPRCQALFSDNCTKVRAQREKDTHNMFVEYGRNTADRLNKKYKGRYK